MICFACRLLVCLDRTFPLLMAGFIKQICLPQILPPSHGKSYLGSKQCFSIILRGLVHYCRIYFIVLFLTAVVIDKVMCENTHNSVSLVNVI